MSGERDTTHLLRSAPALLEAYRTGTADPVEVTRLSLGTLRQAHRTLNCTVVFLEEQAFAAAEESRRRWREGRPRSLEGLPFGIKDVFDLAGAVTTGGSRVHRDRVATETAEAVRRLLDAGAVPVSKDATTEWAIGGPHNPLHGAVRNPWDTRRWAGGSSTGSAAAVAAGAFPFALASDAGGSIRIPSAYCGVTGLKPTNGLVSRHGALPLSWTTESVGPIAASAVDAAMMLAVVAGHDPRDPQSLPAGFAGTGVVDDRLDGVRVGLPGGYFTDGCDAAVLAAFDGLLTTLMDLGAEVVDVAVPSAHAAHHIGYHVLFTEAWTVHAAQAASFADYDPVGLRRMARGSATSARDYLRMLAFRHELQRELEDAFALADVLVMPGTPAAAATLDDLCVTVDGVKVPMYAAQSRATIICNLSGVPALMMPTGFTPDGLPVAAQVVAPPLREDLCLRVGAAFQGATDLYGLDPIVPAAD
ncbi:amidase [Planosporangium thailandense]|uniref:Amidase n=1 Tax=Planosporangium thailandense TaxID=765197 RepID=A0ABX0XVA9_9ACTN|nr:amidase [Planosporangium thailandense]NJC69962.1 amidase [Planosporangium thailandense]